MNSTVASVLKEAGWSASRCVAEHVKTWSESLASRGVTLSPAAASGLTEFGGLILKSPVATGQDFAPIAIHFDPTAVDLDRLADAERALGFRLSPLGEADHGNSSLAIDERGEVYLLYEDHLLVGRSIHEAVELLLLGRRVP